MCAPPTSAPPRPPSIPPRPPSWTLGSTWNSARVTAPFTGRIGAHQVSAGNLVSGSRGGAGPTTLLATIVSLDPIYLDFDMSEADYLAWQRRTIRLARASRTATSRSALAATGSSTGMARWISSTTR